MSQIMPTQLMFSNGRQYANRPSSHIFPPFQPPLGNFSNLPSLPTPAEL